MQTSSISSHQYLSIHLHSGPIGSAAWARTKTVLLLPPSLAPPAEHLPNLKKPSLACVSLIKSPFTVLWQESRQNTGTIYSAQRENEGGKRSVKLKKGERNIHSRNVPLASKPKICLAFAHFFNLSLIELRFQTCGRLSGEEAKESERDTRVRGRARSVRFLLKRTYLG